VYLRGVGGSIESVFQQGKGLLSTLSPFRKTRLIVYPNKLNQRKIFLNILIEQNLFNHSCFNAQVFSKENALEHI